jgi:hypothetical protein
MFKRFIVLLTITFISVAALADVLKVRKGAPQSYTVKKGDTLWDLSAIYLNKPWLWPQLWKINPQINNPHLIYPGNIISLTYNAQGEPQLSINSNVIRLSPKKRFILPEKAPIPTLPLRTIRPYITYEQSLDGNYLDSLPYVMGSTENSKNWIDRQTLYINTQLDPATTYAIYRKGEAYTNPEDNEPLGYETALVATVKVLRPGNLKGEPAAVRVITAITEIKAGDKVLPANEGQTLPVFFKITRPDVDLNAIIIASPSNFREYSKFDVVVLNTGSNNQAKVGNVLDIYHRSPTVVNDPNKPRYLEDSSRFAKIIGSMIDPSENGSGALLQMPNEKIGQLMIFKVYEKLSYALVTAAKKPIRIGDTTLAPPSL